MSRNDFKAGKKPFVVAKRTTLRAQYRAARESLTNLNSTVANLLDGQGAIGGKALVTAYSFTIACLERSAEAAKLPGWKDAAVRPSANPYCQPLKLLAGDMDNITQSRISIWAAVFRNAHAAGIKPEDFLEHRKRNHGMRRWYDFITTSDSLNLTAGNQNKPPRGSRKSPRRGGNAAGSRTAKKFTPVDIVAEFRNAKRIGFVMVDLDAYICDGNAQAELESIPAVIGAVKAAPAKCRKFVTDNDNRFTRKAVA